MAEVDGSVKLGVDFDLAPAKKGAKTIEGTLKELSNMYATVFRSAEQAQNRSTVATQKANEAVKKQEILLESLRAKYAQMQAGDIAPKGLKQLESDIKKSETELNKLIETQIKASEKMQSMDIGLDWSGLEKAKEDVSALDRLIETLSQKISDMKTKAEQLRLSPTATPEAQKLASEISLAEQKLSRLQSEANRTAQSTSKIGKQFKTVPKAMSSALSSVYKFGSSTKKIFTSIGTSIKNVFDKIGKTINKIFLNAKKDTSNFGNFATNMFTRLKGIILSAFVFNAISAGLREITSYIGKVIKTNQEFTRSLQIVKGNLMAAFQPIIDWIAGVDWLSVGQNIGQFLQNAFQFALGFLKTIDTEQIGASLANIINGFFQRLNPETVGATIAEFFNRVFDFVYGFVTTLKWGDIGDWRGIDVVL